MQLHLFLLNPNKTRTDEVFNKIFEFPNERGLSARKCCNQVVPNDIIMSEMWYVMVTNLVGGIHELERPVLVRIVTPRARSARGVTARAQVFPIHEYQTTRLVTDLHNCYKHMC
jgi:hypothetical protein